jgi:hypothetical protein
MVAGDVDNDLFRNGENVTHRDGEGISNLSCRITALYSGRDNAHGASAGLKHFGKRRLGRAGLDRTTPFPTMFGISTAQPFSIRKPTASIFTANTLLPPKQLAIT